MKRGEEEAPAGAADWIVTYSDMITLVLTFFVLMFAMSNVDQAKFALLMAGLSQNGISADEFMAISEQYSLENIGLPNLEKSDYQEAAGLGAIQEKKDGPTSEDPNKPDDSSAPDEGENEDLEDSSLADLFQRLNVWISTEEMDQHLYLHDGEGDGDKLLLTLTSDVWFTPGSADLSNEMKEIGAILGKMLHDTQNEDRPFDIVVSGHTDNVPQHSAQYADNIELSGFRAFNFMRLLIEESGLSPGCFSSRAYGEESPIADNDTPEGRQENRRVEVLISILRAR